MGLTRRDFLVGSATAAGWSGVSFGGFASASWKDDVAENDRTYLRRKFRQDVTDPATGLNLDALIAGAKKLAAERKGQEPWPVVKARLFAYVCDNMAIDTSPHDWFPAIACWKHSPRPLSAVLGERDGEVDRKHCPEASVKIQEGNRAGRHTMWKDFDHSVPDWDVILQLGFPGMKARLEAHRRNAPYDTAVGITAEASLRFIDRLLEHAKASPAAGSRRLKREIAALATLRAGAPGTCYDVMLFTWLFFFLSEHVDHMQVRSLGNIDRLWFPYYQADLAAGRTTEDEFREQFTCFLWQWGSINNYWGQPVYLGGTKADCTTEYNGLSNIILDVLDREALPTPKFQLKIADTTPDPILAKALDMARRHRSLVFCGEAGMTRALSHYGYTAEECRTMVVKGCYEFAPNGSANDTIAGYVNLLKPVEELLKRARDGVFAAATWENFRAAYDAELRKNTETCRDLAFVWETYLGEINPANLYSLATAHSVETGKDAFFNGTARGNNTTILQTGLGTAVDALLAVKELVYERKELSLVELGAVMSTDWKGREPLRLRMLRSKRKWGNNAPEANALGAEIIRLFGACLNGRPNSRGGRFFASGHCAKQFVDLGKKTGATPDGRKASEEMGKNLSPTMGADTEGVTALIATVANLDPRDLPGDFPLDVMLHPSAVCGGKGLEAMKTLLKVYFANGGCAIHFNVFSAEELLDARVHPEKYENLQVRVCGWNVRWNDLPRSEQDAYIRRAEEQMY